MRNIKVILIYFFASLLISYPCGADIYRYIDKHGRVIFTDKPDHKGYKKLVRTWKGWVEQKKPPSTHQPTQTQSHSGRELKPLNNCFDVRLIMYPR